MSKSKSEPIVSRGENEGAQSAVEPAAADDAATGSLRDAESQPQAVSTLQKKTVTGFAKAWIIFWIVGNAAATCAPASYLSDSSTAGIAAVVMLLSAVIVAGYCLLYYRNHIGLYLILIANGLAMFLNSSTVIVKTGLIIGVITYFITRKQVAYPFWRPRVAEQK